MSRRRESRHDLPKRVYFLHGSYFYAPPQPTKAERAAGEKHRPWINLGRDYAKAMKEWAEIVNLPVKPPVTMGDLFERYELQVLPTKAPRTQRDNRVELRFLRTFFGEMAPRMVKPTTVAEYRDARSGKVRANREIALLSHIFTHAVEWGVVDSNPCRGIRRNKESSRDRYVSDQELAAFMKHLPPKWQLYVELKRLLGLRKQDMLQLSFLHVHSDGLVSSVRKTHDLVRFKWNDELRSIVDRILALERPAECQWFFATRKGEAYTESGFDSQWQDYMRAYAKQGGTRFTEHDIRAKVATDLAGEDEDIKKAQRRLVHKSESTTRGYIRRRQKAKVIDLGETL